MTASVDVSDLYRMESEPALVPHRFRRPLHLVLDGAVPSSFEAEVGPWLHAQRLHFLRAGDEEGRGRFAWEFDHVDQANAELFAKLRAKIVEKLPEALEACAVPEFELEGVEMHASVYHHLGHYIWHEDLESADDRRRLAFAYYLRTDPPMFKGGELEFLDGTAIEPESGRLVFFHPLQPHRVRPVECWSADLIHGRWAIHGWVLGAPPPGFAERYERLRQPVSEES